MPNHADALPAYPITGEYPIHRTRFREWCDANGLGGESRHARNRRRRVYDQACRPNRILSGKAPKSGPPKGRPDRNGKRHYWTLEQCRNGGRKSGDMRRWRNRERDNEIITRIKKGETGEAVAEAIQVCLRTVRYVMRRYRIHGRPFSVKLKIAENDPGCNEQFEQQLEGKREAALMAKAKKKKKSPEKPASAGRKKKRSTCKAEVAPQIAVDRLASPPLTRRYLTVRYLNRLHFKKVAAGNSDPRFQNRVKQNIRKTEKEISAYGKPLRKRGQTREWKTLKRNSAEFAQALWQEYQQDLMAIIRQLPRT